MKFRADRQTRSSQYSAPLSGQSNKTVWYFNYSTALSFMQLFNKSTQEVITEHVSHTHDVLAYEGVRNTFDDPLITQTNKGNAHSVSTSSAIKTYCLITCCEKERPQTKIRRPFLFICAPVAARLSDKEHRTFTLQTPGPPKTTVADIFIPAAPVT